MSSFSETDDWTFEEHRKVEQFLHEIEVERKNICVVGDSSLSVFSLGQHNVIDIAVDSTKRDTLVNSSKPTGISISEGRYEPLGLSDDKIIHDKNNHHIVDGFKIIRPEITLAYKRYQNRPNDHDDIHLLEQYRNKATKWDESIYQHSRTSGSRSLLSRGITSLRNDGFVGSGILTIEFLKNRSPVFSRFQSTLPTRQSKSILNSLRNNPKDINPAVLLNHQYRNRTFNSMDTVACYDYIQAKKREQSVEPKLTEAVKKVLTDSEYEALQSVCQGQVHRNLCVDVTPDYRIRNPVDTAALLATRKSTLPLSISIRRLKNRNVEWLRTQSVSEDEIKWIKDRRRELFKQYGLYFYAVLWPPSEEYHDTIESMLASTDNLEIVTKTDLKISNMNSFVHGIYNTQNSSTDVEQINNKIKKMIPSGNTVRVLSLLLENPRIRDKASMTLELIKNEIRNELLSEFPNEFYYCIIHTTDNYEDNKRTRNVLNSEGYSNY